MAKLVGAPRLDSLVPKFVKFKTLAKLNEILVGRFLILFSSGLEKMRSKFVVYMCFSIFPLSKKYKKKVPLLEKL